jgi:geranylgeranyl diphosphate synthase type II
MKKDFSFLKKYKKKFEKEIEKSIFLMGEKTKLRDACEYALMNGGKRFRPIIVMLVSEALEKNFDVSNSALAVEFFHTASLIADDLPSMDNEKKRRNKPVLHKVFGEGIALLASYTFISFGYEMIAKNAKVLKEKNFIDSFSSGKLCSLAIEEVSRVAGIFGATNGQFLDLFPPDNSIETVLKIMKQKTASLFEISFILGWLFGGGDEREVKKVKGAAHHFGMAFQIYDDIKDAEKDRKNFKINIANALGYKKSLKMLKEELLLFEKELSGLGVFTGPFKSISSFLLDFS